LAAVADIRVDVNRARFGAIDRPGRAHFQTAGLLTVFAAVADKEPAEIGGGLLPLLDKADVTPGFVAQGQGVVVTDPGKTVIFGR
jgi:hypothetical protein